jgi:hypothetical protein
MDVSIRDVKDYTCIVIKNVFHCLLLIENICLISDTYSTLRKILKIKCMLKLYLIQFYESTHDFVSIEPNIIKIK